MRNSESFGLGNWQSMIDLSASATTESQESEDQLSLSMSPSRLTKQGVLDKKGTSYRHNWNLRW